MHSSSHPCLMHLKKARKSAKGGCMLLIPLINDLVRHPQVGIQWFSGGFFKEFK